jgi:hypothetical protein
MTDDTKTGFARPPKAHQFKPGESGNPRGRPKMTRNLRTELSEMMKKKVLVRESGKQRRITRQEAMLLSLYDKAVHGDVKAATNIISMIIKLDPSAVTHIDPEAVSETDRAIVEDFIRRHSGDQKGEQ